MADAGFATHVIKVLDAAGNEISHFNYRPSFAALGLDEADGSWTGNPRMQTEYFAFVVPSSDQAAKVIVEQNGQKPSNAHYPTTRRRQFLHIPRIIRI